MGTVINNGWARSAHQGVVEAARGGGVTQRPYVVLSCAMSLDGRIDDATETRLVLSNDADLDRVDALRAGCDAILVGANTIRRDDPRLLVRAEQRQGERVAQGRSASPMKVTLTRSGELDPAARFFTTGEGKKIVYCASQALDRASALRDVAAVVDAGDPVDLDAVLADLDARGVRRLLVEGGSAVHTVFLVAGLVDELQLAVAPFLVGDEEAPRFVGSAAFPYTASTPLRLLDVRQLDDLVLLRYRPDGHG